MSIKKNILRISRRFGKCVTGAKSFKPKSLDFTAELKNLKKLMKEKNAAPLKTRFRKIEYGSSDLSKNAIEFRKNNKIFSARNVAVFEYVEGGNIKTLTMASERGSGHAERLIAKKLDEIGVQPSQVTKIFSELEPCSVPGGYCKRFIKNTFPQAKVTYCFEYGDTASSRAKGVDLLKQSVKTLKE